MIAAILEPHGENAIKALDSASGAVRVQRFDELIRDPGLDGIVIATPSALHAEQAIAALQNKKAVFCQKPLGRSAAEVAAVIEASRSACRLLGVDFSYRHTRAARSLYPMVTSGEIGEVYSADLVFHNAYGPDKPWFYDMRLSGGGCVMDLGVHLVDLALWFMGFPEIIKVESALYGRGNRLSGHAGQVEDFGFAHLETAGGASIRLQCSWNLSAGRDAVIEARFHGSRGGAAMRNINGSFYDFVAEKYEGTRTLNIAAPPDRWGGRAGVAWARRLAESAGHDPVTSLEFLKTAEVIDRIYGREPR